MLIPRSVLAARKCGDVNSTRYALGGVMFTRYNDQPYAVATDGRKLVALTWQEPTVGSATGIDLTPRPGCEFIIPTAALDKVAACKIGAKSRNELHRFIGVEEPADEKTCTAPMMATDGDETARFEPRLQEGRFPRWRDVAPPPTTADITFCVDARQLVTLLETIAAHTGNNKDAPALVTFSVNPENSFSKAIVITAADGCGNKALGVLMPFAANEDDRPANKWQAEADAAEVEIPAEAPAPEVAAPEVEPIAEPVATAGSDEPADDVDEPAPEWLTTARELVAAGTGDNWEAGDY